MKKILILFGISLLLCGCGKEERQDDSNEMISCAEMEKMMASDEKVVLVDVRNIYEFQEGHLEEAVNYPYTTVVDEIDGRSDINKDTTIIVYCKTGNRSDLAYHQLRNAGYTQVYDLGAMSNCPAK